MQLEYPSPTHHHEQHKLPLYIVDILQRNSTTPRQLKISPAAVGCLAVFIMTRVGLKLPASPAFFPPAWMQTVWPQMLLINTLHLQVLLPFLHKALPTVPLQLVSEPSRGHLMASSVRACSPYRRVQRQKTKQGNSGLAKHRPTAGIADMASCLE